jgi:hypothetical protein
MTTRKLAFLLGFIAAGFSTSGATCGGEDSCVSAKKHMCEKIPDMNCYAAFMDTAQQKIVDACGQAELDAYIPAVQNACSASQSSGVAMDCGAIAGKTYAGPQSDAGGGTCDAGAPMTFSYSGTSTADGRAAQLSFTVSGTAVTAGSLYATAVCTSNFHLNSTNVAFTGTLSGGWEAPSGVINASWTGGDYACDGTQLTPDMGYPTSGSLTISMAGSKVRLQRIISNAEPYEFSPTGRTYTPPSATCGTAKADASTGSGSDARTTGDALGPVCTKLAQCCATITDLPSVQSQCYTSVGNGVGDSGCQIAWDDLVHIGYCTGM